MEGNQLRFSGKPYAAESAATNGNGHGETVEQLDQLIATARGALAQVEDGYFDGVAEEAQGEVEGLKEDIHLYIEELEERKVELENPTET